MFSFQNNKIKLDLLLGAMLLLLTKTFVNLNKYKYYMKNL